MLYQQCGTLDSFSYCCLSLASLSKINQRLRKLSRPTSKTKVSKLLCQQSFGFGSILVMTLLNDFKSRYECLVVLQNTVNGRMANSPSSWTKGSQWQGNGLITICYFDTFFTYYLTLSSNIQYTQIEAVRKAVDMGCDWFPFSKVPVHHYKHHSS